jgi:hypothetical protein
VYVDLDSLVTRPGFSRLLQYEGRIAVLGTDRMVNEGRKGGINSSVMLWEAGTHHEIFLRLLPQLPHVQKFVQKFDHWLEMNLQRPAIIQDIFPRLVEEYRSLVSEGKGLPSDVSVVCFPLKPKPHECEDEWVVDRWSQLAHD